MTPAHRSPWRALLSPVALALVALALRVIFSLSMGNRFYFADTVEYEASAMSLLAGHGPGTHTPRAPLYPAFMALGFLIGGAKNYSVVRVLQCLLSTALVLLTSAVASRLAGRAAGIVAGVLMAFGPLYVFTSGMLYPTTLYSLLLLAGVAMALELAEHPRPVPAVLLGIALVLGWLTDQVMIAPIAAILAWLVWQVRRAGEALAGQLALAGAVMALIAVPYIGWQHEAFSGESVFMQKAQYVLYWARTDSVAASTRQVQVDRTTTFHGLPARAFLAQESRLFRTQTLAYVHDVGAEFVHFFKPVPDRVQSNNQYNQPRVLWVAAVHFVPAILLALAGLLFAPAPRRTRGLLALVFLATAVFYSFFFTQTRYRIPVEPEMVVLSALGFVRLFPRVAAALAGEEPEPARAAKP